MATYYNSNYSTQTTVVNGVAYTNNITTIGNSCNIDNTCTDGYSLYFPCIKSITRGQNVCFDFYVGDNANQDELDLRDLDALSLTLSGIFGCTYDTYTYPEDITSLQTENYKEIFSEDFNGLPTNICELKLKYFDKDFQTVQPNITGSIGNFYIGSEIELTADDTPTHIFVGWGKQHDVEYDDACNEIIIDNEAYYGNAYEYIISTDKTYKFIITEDTTLYAIYRERKTYEIRVSYDNRHSHFEVYYNDKRYYLSDKNRDVVKVLEGYHFKVTCIPNKSYLTQNNFYYLFDKWSDGYLYQSREMLADDDNSLLENNVIVLLATCNKSTSQESLNIINGVDLTKDNFIYQYPTTNNIYTDFEYSQYIVNDDIVETNNCSMAYKDNNGFLYLNNGYIKTNLIDVEDGIKVIIKVLSKNNSTLIIEVNGESISFDIDENYYGTYEHIFRNCNYSSIKISSNNALYIDELYVYEEIIENKGEVQLCLSSEDTAKMYTGELYASGAINVDGNIFGISKTLMANINNLTKISLS